MKIKTLTLLFAALLSLTICEAKIPNAKIELAKVYGNCDMCKSRIEKAAKQKGLSQGVWDLSTKMLSITYNSKKTTANDVLKLVAYAGYDSDKFLAPDDAYAKLPGCCQYDRKKVEPVDKTSEPTKINTQTADTTKKSTTKNVSPVSAVVTAYFALKDALAKDDGLTASANAKELFKAIDKADMAKMSTSQHTVWMKYQEKLSYDAEHIKGVTELEHQREHFISLSKNMYEVIKEFKNDVPVYYDFCPMANGGKGATWLSLQEKINNPYFGKQMQTCGKVQETIKL